MTTKAGLQTPRGSRPLALLALVAIVPLLVLGAVLTQWYAAREQGELDLQLQRAAGRTASAVSRELQAQVDLLSIVAESPRLDFPVQSKFFGEIAGRMLMNGMMISSV
jgi:cell division protein FtsB